MKNLSDIELSQDLTRISRSIKLLVASIPSNPATPNDFIEKARIESQIADLTGEQLEIGKELLQRDKAAQQRKVKQLEAKTITGEQKASELLERLPGFADQVSIAFSILSKEYAELLELSQGVRSVNLVLLNANLPQCVHASVKIEPNSLHKILKQQFRASFSANAADVFLPQNTHEFDIVKAVADIREVCHAD